jgi:uncharacterized DUF497 family protein
VSEPEFEWDPLKAASNLVTHGVSFKEAVTIFDDPWAGTALDGRHSYDEERYMTMGWSIRRRLLMVWHTDDGDTIRIIGARLPTATERRTYESGER